MTEKLGLLPYIEHTGDDRWGGYFCNGVELDPWADDIESIVREENFLIYDVVANDSSEDVCAVVQDDFFFLYGLLRQAGRLPRVTIDQMGAVWSRRDEKVNRVLRRLRTEDNPGLGYFLSEEKNSEIRSWGVFTYLTLEERARFISSSRFSPNSSYPGTSDLAPEEFEIRKEIIQRQQDLAIKRQNYELAANLRDLHTDILPQAVYD